MPLSYFDLKKEDTRLVKCDETVYKVKILPQRSVLNGGFSCSYQDAHRQIEEVFRALIYMDQRSVLFKPIHTTNFIVMTTKKAWKTCRKLSFQLHGKPLKACPFQFILKIELKDGPNQSLSNSKSASESKTDSEQVELHENHQTVSDRSHHAKNSSLDTGIGKSESRKSKNESKDAKVIIESYKNVSISDELIIEPEKENEEKNRQILMARIRERERKKKEIVQMKMEVEKIFSETASKKISNKSRKLYTTEVFAMTPGSAIRTNYNTRGSRSQKNDVNTGGVEKSTKNLKPSETIETEDQPPQSPICPKDSPRELRSSGKSKKERETPHSNSRVKARSNLRSSRTPKINGSTSRNQRRSNLRSSQTPKSMQSNKTVNGQVSRQSSQTPKIAHSYNISKERTNLPSSQTPSISHSNNIRKTPRSRLKQMSTRKTVSASQESCPSSQSGLYSVKPLRRSILQRNKNSTPLSKTRETDTDSNQTFSQRESVRLRKMKVVSPVKDSGDSSESSSSSASSKKSKEVRVKYPLRSKAKSLSPCGTKRGKQGHHYQLSNSKNKDKPSKIDLFRPLQMSEKESERLLNLRTTTLQKTRRQTAERVQLDRHDIEKEEIEESMKLQMMSKSVSPKQTRKSPTKRRASVFWDLVDTFISPVKKVLKG